MTTSISLLSILALLGTLLFAAAPTVSSDAGEADDLLRHVVLFSFNEAATEADIKRVADAFAALPDQISEIKGFEWGTNNSPEGLSQGYTHCFLVTFTSEEDRAVYLPHPAHQAFVDVLRPHLATVLVIDYWARP